MAEYMMRKGSLIRLRPEFEERYIILHKHTFPGVLSRIRQSNIRNYTIFLLDGILFSYYEYIGSDYDGDIKALADETTKEWWKLTDPMQESLPTRKQGEWWASMEELFFIGNETRASHVMRYAWTAELRPGSEYSIREQYKVLGMQFAPFVKQFHFQNQATYITAGNLYTYGEYCGDNLSKDLQRLLNVPEVKKWNAELEKNLKTSWREMREVFHTD